MAAGTPTQEMKTQSSLFITRHYTAPVCPVHAFSPWPADLLLRLDTNRFAADSAF
jgi:hypothetical protein